MRTSEGILGPYLVGLSSRVGSLRNASQMLSGTVSPLSEDQRRAVEGLCRSLRELKRGLKRLTRAASPGVRH